MLVGQYASVPEKKQRVQSRYTHGVDYDHYTGVNLESSMLNGVTQDSIVGPEVVGAVIKVFAVEHL